MWNKYFKSVLIVFFSITLEANTASQDNLEQEIIVKLIKIGFENVAILNNNNYLIITYENRVYRNEIVALQKVYEVISPVLGEGEIKVDTIIIIPQNKKIPLIAVSIPFKYLELLHIQNISDEEFVSHVDVTMDLDFIWEKIKSTHMENKSENKIDLVLYPDFKAELDEYGDPVKLQIGIAPAIETTLAEGLSIRGEYIIPIIHRKFKVGKPTDPWRPGLITLNQIFRFPGNFFFSTTLGYFSENRYGIDLEMKKFFADGLISLDANIGYTGEARFYEKKWITSQISDLTYFVNTEVRLPVYNLILSVEYGQYIYKDKGFRVDISRQFGELDIGFYYVSTSSRQLGKMNGGGFNFSIPIFPSEYSIPSFLRVRTAETFSWEYNAYHFVDFHYKRYHTGNDINTFFKRLFPNYIKTELGKLFGD